MLLFVRTDVSLLIVQGLDLIASCLQRLGRIVAAGHDTAQRAGGFVDGVEQHAQS
ncbi:MULTISPECIES: hypothetical protein [unclassified Pseudomonas]|uniref:hypothetical protein n=1 Tax=unclassified Pseudomonas TaxID=196821 RepID=UPI001C49B182|nr:MULTISPECIES: hypothetical protein [unclassified Pseudomonas]